MVRSDKTRAGTPPRGRAVPNYSVRSLMGSICILTIKGGLLVDDTFECVVDGRLDGEDGVQDVISVGVIGGAVALMQNGLS